MVKVILLPLGLVMSESPVRFSVPSTVTLPPDDTLISTVFASGTTVEIVTSLSASAAEPIITMTRMAQASTPHSF
jgi:hypothetical protein